MVDQTKILFSHYRWWGDIDAFFLVVKIVGYPYFEWNGEIYQVNYDEDTYFDTGFRI